MVASLCDAGRGMAFLHTGHNRRRRIRRLPDVAVASTGNASPLHLSHDITGAHHAGLHDFGVDATQIQLSPRR